MVRGWRSLLALVALAGLPLACSSGDDGAAGGDVEADATGRPATTDAASTDAGAPATTTAPATDTGLDALAARFDAGRGQRRLLLLMSPT
jgi:hypothetical protein